MFSSEQDALNYIDNNTSLFLSEMREMEIKTIYTNENTKIKILKSNRNILKFINKYGNKDISDIFKEMIDLRLI